jgi:hypothetical protein
MKKRLLLWYGVTIAITMLFSPLEACASDEPVPSDRVEVSQTLEYLPSEPDVEDSERYDGIETTAYVEPDVDSSSDTTPATTEASVETTTYGGTTSDYGVEDGEATTTSYVETAPSFEATTLEEHSSGRNDYVQGGVSVVTDLGTVGVYTDEVTSPTVSSRDATTTVSRLNVSNDATVHTLANTNSYSDSNSPETAQVTVIVPILLLMAGALFMGATSTPKKR